MKAETKARLQRYGAKLKRFVGDWALPILGGATIGAAWSGHIRSTRLEKEMSRMTEVVNHNASEQQRDRDKLLDLEHQQTLLFERALQVTEGKAD